MLPASELGAGARFAEGGLGFVPVDCSPVLTGVLARGVAGVFGVIGVGVWVAGLALEITGVSAFDRSAVTVLVRGVCARVVGLVTGRGALTTMMSRMSIEGALPSAVGIEVPA
ncbi:MAG: hypothetical protein ACRDJX_00405 [Solirubrobacteraceae bacterium]